MQINTHYFHVFNKICMTICIQKTLVTLIFLSLIFFSACKESQPVYIQGQPQNPDITPSSAQPVKQSPKQLTAADNSLQSFSPPPTPAVVNSTPQTKNTGAQGGGGSQSSSKGSGARGSGGSQGGSKGTDAKGGSDSQNGSKGADSKDGSGSQSGSKGTDAKGGAGSQSGSKGTDANGSSSSQIGSQGTDAKGGAGSQGGSQNNNAQRPAAPEMDLKPGGTTATGVESNTTPYNPLAWLGDPEPNTQNSGSNSESDKPTNPAIPKVDETLPTLVDEPGVVTDTTKPAQFNLRGAWKQIDSKQINTADFAMGGYQARYLLFNDSNVTLTVYCGYGQNLSQRVALTFSFTSLPNSRLEIATTADMPNKLELLPPGATQPAVKSQILIWNVNGDVMTLGDRHYERITSAEAVAFATGQLANKATHKTVAALLLGAPWTSPNTLIIFDGDKIPNPAAWDNANTVLRTNLKDGNQGQMVCVVSAATRLPIQWSLSGSSTSMTQAALAASSNSLPMDLDLFNKVLRGLSHKPTHIILFTLGGFEPSAMIKTLTDNGISCRVDVVLPKGTSTKMWSQLTQINGGTVLFTQ